MKDTDTTPAAESYLDSLSLNCEPFADSIDNRFFYCGTTLMKRLDLLSHLTQFGDSVVLVSGPAGSGKTTLLSRFVSQANSQWHMCLMNAYEFDRFPERLADALKSEAVADEQELFSQWAARTDNSQLLVIIIDSSEHLDETALQRLCVLLEQSANRIRLILFGSPEAQQRHKQSIEQKQLDCSTQLLEMPRLSEEETASYLMYRLAVAGYSGECPFSATEIRAICKVSDGRPAAINQLARQTLLEHPARAGNKRARTSPELHKRTRTWQLATLGVLALAAWLGWQNFNLQPTDEPPAAQTPFNERTLEIPEPSPLATPAETAPPVATTTSPESQAVETQLDAPRQEADPLATIETRLDAAPTNLAPTDVTVEAPPIAGAENVTPDVTAIEHRTAVQEPQKPQEPTADAPDEGILQRTDAQSPVDIPTQPTASEPAPVPESLPHRESWLLTQSEASFSLQLLGSRSAESIAGYIQQHSLDTDKSAVYKGLYRGTEWYVLLYGIYPSRQAALDARVTLPAAVRSDKPWARSLKSVHAAIREVQ